MRKIPLSNGLLYFLEEIEYSEAALLADDDAKALAAAFTEAITEWDGMFKTERAARREVIRAEAVVAIRNEQLDATTITFAKTARGLAPEVLVKVFNVAPGRFIRRALRAQSEHTINVIAVEIGKLAPENAVFAFGAKLKTLAEAALDALGNRAKVKGITATTGNDVDEWKEGINSLRLHTWTELLKTADAKGYPKSWAEAFFRSASAEKEAEEPAPAPKPPTP